MSRARDLADGTFSGAFSADSPTLVVDATNDKVGVGDATPDRGKLQIHHYNSVSSGVFNSPHIALSFNANPTDNDAFGGITYPTSDSDNYGWSVGALRSSGGSGSFVFTHNVNSATGNERARFDPNGNLLVGKTATASIASDTPGHTLYSGGTARHIVDGGEVMNIVRQTSDGNIIGIYKDATAVGQIGSQEWTTGSRTIFIQGQSTAGIRFDPERIIPFKNGSIIDNALDLGDPSFRWDDVYATNGTIQTSDANEKQDIAELDEAEKRVATAAKGLIRKFRWISSVEEKGDDARIHVGIIAQDLKAAFEAEGLDPGRYAMFISNTWWEADEVIPAVEAVDEVVDEDGNLITEAVEAQPERTETRTYDTVEEAPAGAVERTRLGVRYNQLLAFIIGAM